MRYKDTKMSQWPHGLECHLGTRQQLEPGRQTQEELSFNLEQSFLGVARTDFVPNPDEAGEWQLHERNQAI